MNIKLAITALAACTILSAPALADGPKDKKHDRGAGASSVAAGGAVAGRRGAAAVGGAASQTEMGKGSRRVRCVPSTSSTTMAGAAHTTRRSGSSAVTTSGTASGSGVARSASDGEVWAMTTGDGSDAGGYGSSEAVARNSDRC